MRRRPARWWRRVPAFFLVFAACGDDGGGAGVGDADVTIDGGDMAGDQADMLPDQGEDQGDQGLDLTDLGLDLSDQGVDVEVDMAIELPTDPPESVTMVASTGFSSPGDAVASPDGSMFYFTAFTTDDDPTAAIFSVPSAGGAVNMLVAGDPLEYPTGLVMSCDGSTLYVADMSVGDAMVAGVGEGGALYSVDLSAPDLELLDADGISVPSGLAMGSDCETLHITGFNDTGQPALFTLSTTGGTADETISGDPLVSPTGVHVDSDDVAWVVDHLAMGEDGPGALFSITLDGDLEEEVSNLRLGAPGGVSLAAGGQTAVIPEVDERGDARLVTYDTATGTRDVVDAPAMVDPAGIRTARRAGVFVVVDNEGGAIFRAE